MKHWVGLLLLAVMMSAHAQDQTKVVEHDDGSGFVVGYEYGIYQESEGVSGSTNQLVIEYRFNESFGISAEYGNLGLETEDYYGPDITLDATVTQFFANMYLPLNDTFKFTLGAGLWSASTFEGCAKSYGYCFDVDGPSESITAQLGMEVKLHNNIAGYLEWEALTYSDEVYENENFITLGINYRF